METLTCVIECDRDGSDELAAVLRGDLDASVTSATKRNLDGAAETVLQIIELAVTAGGAFLPMLVAWVRRDHVRKIRVGDVEIDNPTPEQVETMWSEYLASRRPES